jgi:hypothetical protein
MDSSSVKSEIYRIIAKRIRKTPGLSVIEIILWTIAAVYLGLITIGFLTARSNEIIFHYIYWAVIGFTPPFVGALVWRAKVPSYDDQEIRTMPVRPSELFAPAIAAITIYAVRILLPLLLLMTFSHHIAFGHAFSTVRQDLYVSAGTSLTEFPYKDPYGLALQEWRRAARIFDYDYNYVPLYEVIAVVFLAFLQSAAWITLPVTWGIYQFSRLGKHSLFWVVYVLYLLFPAIPFFMNWAWRVPNYVSRRTIGSILRSEQLFPIGDLKWPWLIAAGIFGVLLSFAFYLDTLSVYRRRV